MESTTAAKFISVEVDYILEMDPRRTNKHSVTTNICHRIGAVTVQHYRKDQGRTVAAPIHKTNRSLRGKQTTR